MPRLLGRLLQFFSLLCVLALAFGGTALPTLAAPAAAAAQHRPDIKHDVSPPLRDLRSLPRVHRQHERDNHRLPPLPHAPASRAPRAPVQTSPAHASAPVAGQNFEGVGQGFTGPSGTFNVNAAPPDPNGTVGPNNYVETVNTDLAVFNKSGGAVYGPVTINTLWTGFGGNCQTDNDGDPSVVYDQLANRWIVMQFAVTNPSPDYLLCIAVSTSGDPTGSYYRYAFTYSSFPDYPKLGVWSDGYYVTTNQFDGGSGAFLGGEVAALDRASMLQGQPAAIQSFSVGTSFGGLLPSTVDGAAPPPAGSPDYVVSLADTADLAAWNFHVDWATPANTTLSGPAIIPVGSFAEACNGGTCIPQYGTRQQLDSLADRLMYRLAYRNFGDHQSLVVDHSVAAGSGVGVRWYELRVNGTALTLYQQGTYAPDSNDRWMGSVAMDHSGNMALGFSLSGSRLHPEIHDTGRLAGDPLGVMTQGEGTIINGNGSQTGNLSRWGDYSSLAVDPSDGCTFWYTQEYLTANGSFNWHTRIGTFKLANCAAPVSSDFSLAVSPASLTVQQGSSGTTTVTSAVTSGSAQSINLSAGGLPSGVTVGFNPSAITAGGSSTVTLNVGAATTAGTYSVTITGAGASASHSTTLSLTVTATTNDFSLAVNPSSLSLQQGASGAATVSTAVTSGTAQSVTLSASGLPVAVTAGFAPNPLTAGSASTLTISASATTPAGSYTVTITGSGPSTNHSAPLTLTVTVPPPSSQGISNGGFESGNLSGWTTVTGTAGVSTSSVHSGSDAAQLGSTSPTNGDSSISQTFTVPSNVGTLSFWYLVHCPDTVAYDWATAQLKDSSTGATSTILGKTCTDTGTWQQVTAAVTSGHAYTLTLTSHDDNYPADPTYTNYDDVALLAPVTSSIVNGGFETGNLNGWSTVAGTTGVTTNGVHSGSHAAQLGSTSPTNGDSSISQRFTAPAGAGTLSLWYAVHCPDMVSYDWATATLADSTAGTTTTVLPPTCTNNGAWQQIGVAITAGHAYTLTLTSHDDNYGADPTYTEYDDVTVH